MMNREKFPIRPDNTLFVIFIGGNDFTVYPVNAYDLFENTKKAILKIYDTVSI